MPSKRVQLVSFIMTEGLGFNLYDSTAVFKNETWRGTLWYRKAFQYGKGRARTLNYMTRRTM